MTLTVFDTFLLLLGIIVVIRVTVRGFVAEFFSMAAFLVALAMSFLFCNPLAAMMGSGFSLRIRVLIAFFIIFITVFIIFKLLQKFVASIFQNEILHSLDHALALFLGIFEAYIIIIIVLAVLQLQPLVNLDSVFADSVIARILLPLPVKSDDVLQIIKGVL